MAEYQSPEDAAAFTSILERDPESRKCFECNYPNAPWCDINHGVFICLDCSGVHRSLGVHLSFVRSSTMDGWSSWRPEKLRQMQIGGNARARKFFDAKGVPKSPIRARYEHVGALMYKDLLEAETAGRPFNEAAWQPPDWAIPKPLGGQQGRGGSGMAPPERFRGHGTAAPRSTSTSSDWLDALTTNFSSVTTQASQLATAAVQNTQHLATKLSETAHNAPTTIQAQDLSKKAQETAAAATSAVASAWGALSSWTTSLTTATPKPSDDDDGLADLTRKLKNFSTTGSVSAGVQDSSRLRGVEHKATAAAGSRGSDELSALASTIPRSEKYEGIGSEDTSSRPSGNRPLADPQQNTKYSPAPQGQRLGSSPVPASSPTAAAGSPTQATQKKSGGSKSTVPSDWGWD